MFIHRTSLSVSGFLLEMSNTTPPTKKMACLSMASRTQEEEEEGAMAEEVPHSEHLVTADQAMYPP